MYDSNTQLAKPKWGTLSHNKERFAFMCTTTTSLGNKTSQDLNRKIITNTFYIAQIDGDKSAELENRGTQAQRLILLNLFSIDFVGPFQLRTYNVESFVTSLISAYEFACN
jgi:hypothetical protein